jgi:L-cysteine S-thiosulfotransferase
VRALPLLILLLSPSSFPQSIPDTRKSGFEFMSPATQAMQRDDNANPGMLWVKDGEALWSRPAGAANKACVTCHAQASSSMRGVAARYPAFDAALGRPVTLGQRINQCRQQHQQAPAAKAESEEALGLEAYVAHQSRGMPISPPKDPRLAAARERGEVLWRQRIGQVNLSCAQCHDGRAGLKLAGSVIPQGHATGYPLYRLEWQGVGSLERRIRGCMTGVRAEAYAFDSRELVGLQVYLAGRAEGMRVDTPGVRP